MVEKAWVDLTHRFSRWVGWVADTPVPTALRHPLWSGVGRALGVDAGCVKDDLASFETFGSFFGRALEDGARPVAEEAVAVAPCDGVCVAAGSLSAEDATVRVKGHTYSVEALLGIGPADVGEGTLHYWVIYLAPKDYHRVHAPLTGSLRAIRHMPGSLFPVNALGVRLVPALFTRNERVIFSGNQANGCPWAMAMVGALGVGSIAVTKESPAQPAGSTGDEPSTTTRESEIHIGSEIAAFKLGSTVILGVVTKAPLSRAVQVGSVCRMGEPLFA